MERTAKCLCGGFCVIATGAPGFVNVCHCQDCQRRSGVPWTSNAFYKKSSIRLEGTHKIYARTSAAGRKIYHHFCPACGATVCWIAELLPDAYGVAMGAFNDPTFPSPSFSIWEHSMYAWVPSVPEVEHFSQALPGAPQI